VSKQLQPILEPINYLPPVFRPEGEKIPKTDTDFDVYVKHWMQEPADHELWILGDFGTGKTTFCQHFAKRLLDAQDSTDERIPIPVIVPLSKGIQDDEKLLYGIRKGLEENGARLKAGSDTVRWLLKEHRIIILCDGLDECPWDFTGAKQALEGRGKIIVTCRTHYFKTLEDYTATLGYRSKTTSNVDIVELLGVDERAIKLSINKQPHGNKKTLELAFNRWPHLWKMAQRPLWLNLIMKMIPKEGSDKPPRMADLYDYSIRESLRTRMTSPESESVFPLVIDILSALALTGFLSGSKRTYFTKEHLLGKDPEAKHVKDTIEEAREKGDLLPKADNDLFAMLIGKTILIHNLYSKPDTYSFGHLSFQEYLSARALMKRRAEGEREAEVLRGTKVELSAEGKHLLKENLSRTDWAEIACFTASITCNAELVIKLCIEEYKKQIRKNKHYEFNAAKMLFLGARAIHAAQNFDNKSNKKLGDLIVSLFQGKLARGYHFLEQIYRSLAFMGDAGKETLKRNIERNQLPGDGTAKAKKASQMRRRCILAWYESFPSEAMEQVLPFLDEEIEQSVHVHWHAAEVVSEVATKDNVALLKKYAESTNPIVQGNILWAFKRCKPHHPLAKHLNEKLIRRLKDVVNKGLGKEHSFHPRAHGALLLGRCMTATEHQYGDQEAIGKKLCELLKDKKSKWRGYVTRGLLELEWKGAVPHLCEYLKGKDDEIWQRYAVDAIVKLAKKEHIVCIERTIKPLKKRYQLLSQRLSRHIQCLQK
jgi:hypothetical protein